MSRNNRKKNKNKEVKTAETEKPQTKEEAVKEASEKASNPPNGVETAGRRNDPEWYSADPQLLTDAASINYSHPFGEAFRTRSEAAIGWANEKDGPKSGFSGAAMVTPGIAGVASFLIKPSIGYSDTWLDPANVAANAFYAHIRYNNNGRKNYDPVDLMMYVLAMSDVYSYIMFCKRIYAKTFMYSQVNKYIGKQLLRADGVSYDNVLSNLANFRYWLNTFINKVSSFVVPADISLLKRRVFMYAGLYLENGLSNIKDQMYQFTPDGFYKFKYDSDGAGMLEYTPFRSHTTPAGDVKTVSDLITYGEALLDNINNNEDFGLMSGDILKAYDPGSLVGLTPQDEEAAILPVYDPYILSQFKNATVLGHLNYGVETGTARITFTEDTKTRTAGDIYQYNGLIKCKEVQVVGPNQKIGLAMRKLLSVENPTPGPVDTMEATRLMVGYIGQLGGNAERTLVRTGTEICVGVLIYEGRPSPTTTMEWPVTVLYSNILTGRDIKATSSTTDPEQIVTILSLAALQFKYMPTRYYNAWDDITTTAFSDNELMSNLDNVTLIDDNIMARLHECALLGLFYVPGVAKMVGSLASGKSTE